MWGEGERVHRDPGMGVCLVTRGMGKPATLQELEHLVEDAVAVVHWLEAGYVLAGSRLRIGWKPVTYWLEAGQWTIMRTLPKHRFDELL